MKIVEYSLFHQIQKSQKIRIPATPLLPKFCKIAPAPKTSAIIIAIKISALIGGRFTITHHRLCF